MGALQCQSSKGVTSSQFSVQAGPKRGEYMIHPPLVVFNESIMADF